MSTVNRSLNGMFRIEYYLKFLVFFVHLNTETNCNKKHQSVSDPISIYLNIIIMGNVSLQTTYYNKVTYQQGLQSQHKKVLLKEKSWMGRIQQKPCTLPVINRKTMKLVSELENKTGYQVRIHCTSNYLSEKPSGVSICMYNKVRIWENSTKWAWIFVLVTKLITWVLLAPT